MREGIGEQAVAGWQEDQRWTLARIAQVIRERFGVSYTPAGVWVLLHRKGWSVQVPSRQSCERDEAAIEAWRKDQWPRRPRDQQPIEPRQVRLHRNRSRPQDRKPLVHDPHPGNRPDLHPRSTTRGKGTSTEQRYLRSACRS
jgi:hypothetical protein